MSDAKNKTARDIERMKNRAKSGNIRLLDNNPDYHPRIKTRDLSNDAVYWYNIGVLCAIDVFESRELDG